MVRASSINTPYSFFGITNGGKKQVFSAIFFHLFQNGKILKTWRNHDDPVKVLQAGSKHKFVAD